MQFLKLCCWKEALKADITIGEIKQGSISPMLEINVAVSYGSIRQNTDFLYLKPQSDSLRQLTSQHLMANTSTASSVGKG